MKQSKIIVCVKSGVVQGIRSDNPNISVDIWDEDAPEDIFEKYGIEDNEENSDPIKKYFKDKICKEYPCEIL